MSSNRYLFHPNDLDEQNSPASLTYNFHQEQETQQSQSDLHGTILFVAVSRDENDWPSEPHSHYFTEIFYITDGRGTFEADGHSFSVEENDLVLLNPYTIHTEFSSASESLEYIVIGIDGLQFVHEEHAYLLLKKDAFRKNLRFYFQALADEMQHIFPYRSPFCENLLQIILIHILRNEHISLSLIPAMQVRQECADVKKYMDLHYKEPITLDELAEIVHWNKYHLAHLFTQAYGMPPMRYLQQKRVAESKYLLVATEYSLPLIAHQTGFSSASYYSQSFKKLVHISPQEYRRNHKASDLRNTAKEKQLISE